MPLTFESCNVGSTLDVIMISIPTLPLAKAVRASVASQVMELGSTMRCLVAQSNQNLTAASTGSEVNWAVLRSFET